MVSNVARLSEQSDEVNKTSHLTLASKPSRLPSEDFHLRLSPVRAS